MELDELKWKFESHLNDYGDELTQTTNEQLLSDAKSILDAIQEHNFLQIYVSHIKDFQKRVPIELGVLAGIMVMMLEDINDVQTLTYEQLEQKHLKRMLRNKLLSKLDFMKDELNSLNVVVDVVFMNDIDDKNPHQIGVSITPNCPDDIAEKIKSVLSSY